MENESNTPQEPDEEPTGGDWLSETKNWIQDNIRIVLSVIIVLAIGFGVYFYSKRGAENTELSLQEETTENAELKEKLLEGNNEELSEEEKQKLSEEARKIAQEEGAKVENNEPAVEATPQEEAQPTAAPTAEPTAAPTVQPTAEPTPQPTPEVKKDEPQKPETVINQSAGNYEVTAASGDSLTTLARSAVKQYLDANNDSSITKEHKIYIEDYLAKRMGNSNRLKVGEVKTFGENDIKSAIDAAKQLTPNQLEHLKIFSERVSNI